jgi:hypothetical protein
MPWRWFRSQSDGPQPPRRSYRPRHKKKHGDPEAGTGCGEQVATYPTGRFYPHSPCDSNTVEIRRADEAPEEFSD